MPRRPLMFCATCRELIENERTVRDTRSFKTHHIHGSLGSLSIICGPRGVPCVVWRPRATHSSRDNRLAIVKGKDGKYRVESLLKELGGPIVEEMTEQMVVREEAGIITNPAPPNPVRVPAEGHSRLQCYKRVLGLYERFASSSDFPAIRPN